MRRVASSNFSRPCATFRVLRTTESYISASEMFLEKTCLKDFWNGLIGVAMAIVVLPLLWPDSVGPQTWRSSQFIEWEISSARYPQLLDAINRTRLMDPEPEALWTPPKKAVGISTKGYLQVFLDGGLNQQRMGVCDAVAVAKILNVTLVVPHFDWNPVWQDTSMFADIFDVDHFVRFLENDVHIVTEVPPEFGWSSREYYATGLRETRIKDAPAHAGHLWFQNRLLPVIQRHGIAAIAPFTHRLGFEGLPSAIQKLRCRVNFEALQLRPSLRSLGDLIVQRLHGSSPWKITGISANGATEAVDGVTKIENRSPSKFVALHLRFDKDMIAHSSCGFGGGRAEELALSKYRRDFWNRGVSNKLFTIDEVREQGKCPLTPEEVGIVLAGLGFPSTTLVYLASHKVYGGEARMAHLRALFPFVLDKYSLATDGEIQPYKGKSSQLAALDYHVSLHSDAFLSASRGNMHNALVGHRSYEINGLTIRPDMPLVAHLFGNKSINWSDFQNSLRTGHQQRMGQLNMRKSFQSIYTYPAPDCMCALG